MTAVPGHWPKALVGALGPRLCGDGTAPLLAGEAEAGAWKMHMHATNALMLTGDDDAFAIGRKQGAGDRIAAIVIGHDEDGAAALMK